jgi:hypothetical protein
MRRQPVLATAACLILLTGCGAIRNGTYSGVVRGYGGFGPSTDGRPMPNQDIYFFDDQNNRITVTSDADGNYSVSLPPGQYRSPCFGGNFTVEPRQNVTKDCVYSMG